MSLIAKLTREWCECVDDAEDLTLPFFRLSMTHLPAGVTPCKEVCDRLEKIYKANGKQWPPETPVDWGYP